MDLISDLLGKRLIVYGAGRIGRQLLPALKSRSCKIEFFWDKYWDTNNKEPIDGIPVLPPNPEAIPLDRRHEYCVIVTVTAKEVSHQMADNLTALGYNAIWDRGEINTLIYQTCKKAVADGAFVFDLKTCHTCPVPKENTGASCDIFDSHLVQSLAKGAGGFEAREEKLIVPKLGLLIGNKCNLCCKGCNHLVDLYKPGDAVSLSTDDVLSDVNKIVEAVDLVNKIVVVGGEAFLHPNLCEILEKLLDLPKIGSVQIITNGSILPKDQNLLKLLSDKRVIVEISGYGSELPVRLGENVKNFEAELKKYGVSYYYMGTLQWYDFGDFSKRPYSPERHQEVYETCCSVSNDIWNGRLYKCSRSALATHLGHIPKYEGDYVDLRLYSGDDLRERLLKFFEHNRPQACLHCNGASVGMEAGVQVPRFQVR